MRRFSRDARGFSLVEALIAIAVAALLIGALVDLFLATQRDAAVTEDRLTDVLAAQSVGELLRSKLASNPAFLRDFAPGPDGKVHLTGSDLHCTALGQETVDVTLENDNELEPQQPVPELTALVQRATITVTHAQRFGEAPVRLTVRLVVPPDSLPAAALAKLYETHAAVFDVRTEQTAFRQQLAAWQVDLPPGYATPPDDDMNLLADANQLWRRRTRSSGSPWTRRSRAPCSCRTATSPAARCRQASVWRRCVRGSRVRRAWWRTGSRSPRASARRAGCWPARTRSRRWRATWTAGAADS